MDGANDIELADFELLERLEIFARDNGYDLLTLAISWLAVQPCIASVISGASKPEQLLANANASRWKLSASDMEEVDRLLAS
tara:strand:- start:380 stop:625 length:246 start_codon:yes stop_codon:yes gene_type:complete